MSKNITRVEVAELKSGDVVLSVMGRAMTVANQGATTTTFLPMGRGTVVELANTDSIRRIDR